MENSEIIALANEARELMPPASRFREQDEAVLLRHQDFLSRMEIGLTNDFYDTVFGHQPTAEVFKEGERAARERTFGGWWRRTLAGPHDDEYFGWMAMVGLVHVIRGVSNPMMLSMSDFIARAVEEAARAEIAPEEAPALADAFRRLMSTVGSVITYGYDLSMENALFDVAGMPRALLHRLRDQEVSRVLSEARTALGRERDPD